MAPSFVEADSATPPLGEHIAERTAWLIENHMIAHKIRTGEAGARLKRRLQQHPDYETLLLLQACDDGGRVPGAAVPDLEEALDAIRETGRMCGE